MTDFEIYLKMGFEHISDLGAYDHILFLVALCAAYNVRHWRQIVVLVTAFTIGHSLALAAATLGWIDLSMSWDLGERKAVQLSLIIEFLIPLTILLTALSNLWQKEEIKTTRAKLWRYGMGLGFGLIHGLGFSNYLQSLLGREESIFLPLLSFNIGLELGQLMIVGVIMLIALPFQTGLKVPVRSWNLFVSGAAAGVAWVLLIQTKFW
ncbi:MAG: HupE/UreJ family protein [Bacteroidota bacterium]